MGAAEFTEQVHPIGTQHELDVPRLITKLLGELGVETLPLLAIGRVSQLAIALRALKDACHDISLASSGFPNTARRRSIMGRYHIDRAGIFLYV
jgi:hypothetical protein